MGLFRSRTDLAEQMKQAARMPSMENTARNLLLNQRVTTDAPFVSPGVWKANGAEPLPFDGPVFGGLDLSARNDLTALVLVGPGGGGMAGETLLLDTAGGLGRARAPRPRPV
ncbi:MAG: hypothetical protein GAK34_00626 [Delftia tsuruhatensis]|nr:MAG: hypothetical protein GAK34_00626 [Delftia tsuruhatensis]